MRIFLLTFLFSINVEVLLGQTEEPIPPPPPPMEMAMPSQDNIALVDNIIEVTEHEKFFIGYCTDKVNRFARKNGWTAAKTTEILNSIQFKYFKSTIYNAYAMYTSEQLNRILQALTLLNRKSTIDLPMVLTNSMMQSNLDLLVDDLIAGKYVTGK